MRSPTTLLWLTAVTILGITHAFSPQCFAEAQLLSNSTAPKATITFGYLRMAAVDDENILAGMISTLSDVNVKEYVKDVQFVLDFVTIPCNSSETCTDIVNDYVESGGAAVDAYLAPFIDRMANFTAILKPNHLLAPLLIDTLDAKGFFTPVIDPATIRAKDFVEGSDNIINFDQSMQGALSHVFTWTQQSTRCGGQDAGCAVSGILYERFSEMADYVEVAQKMFTDGGLRKPPAVDVETATNEELIRFFTEDPHRKCFFVLTTHHTFVQLADRLAREAGFQASSVQMYGTSLMGGASFIAGGNASSFLRTHFIRWSPPYLDSKFEASKTIDAIFHTYWKPDVLSQLFTASELNTVVFSSPTEAVPSTTQDGTLLAYLITMYLVEGVRASIGTNYKVFNTNVNNNAAVPLPTTLLIDTFYSTSFSIGGFPFDRLSKSCGPVPLPQTCYCNTPTRTSYLVHVNGSHPTGQSFAYYDNVAEGQRSAATLFLNQGECHMRVSSRSYPITVVALAVNSLANFTSLSSDIEAGDRAVEGLATVAERVATQKVLDGAFAARVYAANYAPIAPARPYRYVAAQIELGKRTMDAMREQIGSYNPFIVVSSSEGKIKESDTLTLIPNLMRTELEDPPLTTMDTWQSNIINILPVIADYIHAVAAYYAENQGKFTSLHVITSHIDEAALVSKSLATFQIDYPIPAGSMTGLVAPNIMVSASPAVWEKTVSDWFTTSSASPRPFIIVVTAHMVEGLTAVGRVVSTAGADRSFGRIVIASSLMHMHHFKQQLTLTGDHDVLIPSFLNEWWTPHAQRSLTASEAILADDPAFWYGQIASDVTQQLAQRVQYDYTTKAATILYELQTLTSLETTFGPFSNRTCTAEQVMTNARNRDCQCTKGARTIFMLSVADWQMRLSSTRTNGFRYTMPGCGIQYAPFIHPPEPLLSDGALAGIIVGCSAFVIGLVVFAIVFLVCCTGRNNRNAPKDASKPFTIVFTDIQSSTALWAHAPAAMADAVEMHHELIRKCIRRHSGYEVKTIGDSFMVAFCDPHDAMAFSLEVQHVLFEGEWNEEIDACYVEILTEAVTDAAMCQSFETNPAAGASAENERRPSEGDGSTKGLIIQVPQQQQTYSRSSVGLVGRNGSPRLDAASNNGPSPFFVEISNTNNANNEGHPSRTYAVSVTPSHTSLRASPLRGENGEAAGPANGISTDVSAAASSGNVNAGNNTNVFVSAQTFQPGFVAQSSSALPFPSFGVTGKPQNGTAAGGGGNSSTIDSTVLHAIRDTSLWHGLRVRVGVHTGMGEIKKDPVSLGYDYYGTVVNTAARVEGVGHGGQILMTQATQSALDKDFLLVEKEAISVSLGPQPLRGLDAPIVLYQVLPQRFQLRKFPALRLNIENDITEDTTNDTTTNGSATEQTVTAFDIAQQLCLSKQYNGSVSTEELLTNLNVLTTVLGPTRAKWQHATIAKIGDSWGFERSAKAVEKETSRTRLLVNLMGKVTRTINMNNRRRGWAGTGGGSTSNRQRVGTRSQQNSRSSQGGSVGATNTGVVMANQFNNIMAGAYAASTNSLPTLDANSILQNNINNNTSNAVTPIVATSVSPSFANTSFQGQSVGGNNNINYVHRTSLPMIDRQGSSALFADNNVPPAEGGVTGASALEIRVRESQGEKL